MAYLAGRSSGGFLVNLLCEPQEHTPSLYPSQEIPVRQTDRQNGWKLSPSASPHSSRPSPLSFPGPSGRFLPESTPDGKPREAEHTYNRQHLTTAHHYHQSADTSAKTLNPPVAAVHASTEMQSPRTIVVLGKQKRQKKNGQVTRRSMNGERPNTSKNSKAVARSGNGKDTSAFHPTLHVSPVSPTMSASSISSSSEEATLTDIDKRRRIVCTVCKKAFTTSGHLARHSRIHTGIKPFGCLLDGCPSRFSRQDNMMQHYRCHLVQKKGTTAGGSGYVLELSNLPLGSTTSLASPTSSVPWSPLELAVATQALEDGSSMFATVGCRP
ncbi:hypothetical protein DFS34DRAFT_159731 [Phlyctochytrium arcticum]|nr:hypothetical protein DFS34DRAFT_159731 [Phlyctochytrium arcticum]